MQLRPDPTLRRLGPTVKVNDLKCHMLWNSHPMLRSLRSLISHAIELGVTVCCLMFGGWGGIFNYCIGSVLVNWWFGSRWSDTPKVTSPFLRGSLEKIIKPPGPFHICFMKKFGTFPVSGSFKVGFWRMNRWVNNNRCQVTKSSGVNPINFCESWPTKNTHLQLGYCFGRFEPSPFLFI